MADWTVAWQPKTLEKTPVFNTAVTRFRDASNQYAALQDAASYRFRLSFDYQISQALIYAIEAFFIARKGRYESFTFPCYSERIKGTTLACANSDPDTITDSGSGILVARFAVGGKVTITGSTASNDKVADIHATTAPIAGTLTLAADETLNAESSNSALTIYNTYDVHFDEDMFYQRFIQVQTGAMRTIELYAESY